MFACLPGLALIGVLAGQLVDGHVHRAPHGGLIVHAGPVLLEVVVDQHRVRAWTLTEQGERVIPPGKKPVRLTIKQPMLASQAIVLQPQGDHFEAGAPLDGVASFTATAVVPVGASAAKASFRWTALDAIHRLDDRVEREGQKLQE